MASAPPLHHRILPLTSIDAHARWTAPFEYQMLTCRYTGPGAGSPGHEAGRPGTAAAGGTHSEPSGNQANARLVTTRIPARALAPSDTGSCCHLPEPKPGPVPECRVVALRIAVGLRAGAV